MILYWTPNDPPRSKFPWCVVGEGEGKRNTIDTATYCLVGSDEENLRPPFDGVILHASRLPTDFGRRYYLGLHPRGYEIQNQYKIQVMYIFQGMNSEGSTRPPEFTAGICIYIRQFPRSRSEKSCCSPACRRGPLLAPRMAVLPSSLAFRNEHRTACPAAYCRALFFHWRIRLCAPCWFFACPKIVNANGAQ